MLNTDQNHISVVRAHMLDQLKALRTARIGEDLDEEIRRSKSISDIAQTIVNAAKVEIDYLVATGQNSSPFLDALPYTSDAGDGSDVSDDKPKTSITHDSKRLPGNSNGITSIVQHRLRG